VRGTETLVESTYGASQHLNYHAYRNTMQSLSDLSAGLLLSLPSLLFSLVSSGGEFQMFPYPGATPCWNKFVWQVEPEGRGMYPSRTINRPHQKII
jgi:hypothetical protein